jgi:Domain of unknown function (DUF4112)
MEQQNQNQNQAETKYPELLWLDRISHLMDNSIPIPFTQRRFGLDAVAGLVPYAGDMTSFAVSGLLIFTITRHGVSFGILLKMIGNIILDAVVGSVPIVGDLFDMSYKANRKNMKLLKAHYDEDGYRMNAWLAGGILLAVVVAVFIGMVFLVGKVGATLWNMLLHA